MVKALHAYSSGYHDLEHKFMCIKFGIPLYKILIKKVNTEIEKSLDRQKQIDSGDLCTVHTYGTYKVVYNL